MLSSTLYQLGFFDLTHSTNTGGYMGATAELTAMVNGGILDTPFAASNAPEAALSTSIQNRADITNLKTSFDSLPAAESATSYAMTF